MRKALLATTMLVTLPIAAHAQEITPGVGSLTDSSGHVWTITATTVGNGAIEEDGVQVPGGHGTSALTISNGVVYGLDWRGGGWFTMNSVNPAHAQYWTTSAPPPNLPASATPATASTPATTSASALAPIPVQQCPAGSTASTGGFHMAGGQIIGPDGKPWTGRGLDVHAGNLSAAAQMIPQQFPGTNLIRVAVDPLDNDPSIYDSAVAAFTARGTVVQFSDYTNSLGTGGGGGQGVVFTGALLANELAWFQRMASHFANNPYVWLGSNNEPAEVGGSLSDWQKTTYDTIRAAGNTAPILLETSGSGDANSPLQSGMNQADYAGMTNIIWDPHVYGFQDNWSTDPATADALVVRMVAAAQSIQSADGVVPVIIGEYSPWGGQNGGFQVVQAVINAGSTGKVGSAAWVWDSDAMVGGTPGDPTGAISNSLLSGGQITTFGQMVQLFANTNVVPLSNCQQTAAAQTAINSATASLTTPAATQ